MIDPTDVDAAIKDCLYRDTELTPDGGALLPDQPAPVIVNAIMANFGFHPERLAAKRATVIGWLQQLPIEFQPIATGGGGGWSTLNMCTLADGTLWTGEQRLVDALCALAIGLGLATWGMPRPLWSALPGGMPYIVIKNYEGEH